MLKLTGTPGAYRVIDDQTGAVVLNAVNAHYAHYAGSPPRLVVDIEGATIDARVLVAGELCRVTGDGRNTDVSASDGTSVRNMRSVDVHAGSVVALGVVTLAEVSPGPEEATAEPEATEPPALEPDSLPDPVDEPETPAEEPSPLEATPADPTAGGSVAESASETSSGDAEGEPPAPRTSRRPRG